MIKKLKFKLIAVCLLSVSIVLAIIVSTSYIAAILNITRTTDTLISIIHNNGDVIIHNPNDVESNTYDSLRETRYFIVKSYDVSKPDEILVSNTSISNTRVNMLAKRAENERLLTRGYVDGFRYRKFDIEENNTKIGETFIFVDCGRQIFNIRFMLVSATVISLLSLLTIFSLLRLFSNKILKPIIDAHEKQKKFITNASHELKTPLTVITANNELLEMEYGDNEYTKTISKQVLKLTSMTNTLVTLSKLDEMNTLEDMSDFNVSDAAYDTINLYSKVINNKFTYDVQENLTLCGNEKLIRDLLTILLDNARKYSTSYVKFSINKYKSKIHITCENDAANLKKGSLDHFAERFYRSDESRVTTKDGSGVGLSLAKDIVEIHRGSMKIYSPDGEICIINIYL